MTRDYEVRWTVSFPAEGFEDALSQGWALLSDAVNDRLGATIIFVEDGEGNKVFYDMEDTGFCWYEDGVHTYTLSDRIEHCASCGACWMHHHCGKTTNKEIGDE